MDGILDESVARKLIKYPPATLEVALRRTAHEIQVEGALCARRCLDEPMEVASLQKHGAGRSVDSVVSEVLNALPGLKQESSQLTPTSSPQMEKLIQIVNSRGGMPEMGRS